MKRRFAIAAAVFAASLTLTSAAQGGDSLAGALLGAGAGAVVGHAVGGRDGAIVGGGIGAIAGAAIASQRLSYRDEYAKPMRSAYHEEPVVVERSQVRYVERTRDWDDHRWEHRDRRLWRTYRPHTDRCWHD